MLQNQPALAASIPGLHFEPLFLDNGTAKFDLTLILEPAGDGTLAGYLEHSFDLFDTATAQRLAAYLSTLLAGLADAPRRRVSEPGSDETVAFAIRNLPSDVMPGAIFRLPASRTSGM